MAKDFARAFYHSRAWLTCRESYIARRRAIDGGLCETCREQLGYIVHHRTALTPENIGDQSVTLNHSNLRYVCKLCHDEQHGVGRSVCPLLSFDGNGDPIPPHKSRGGRGVPRTGGPHRKNTRAARMTPLP